MPSFQANPKQYGDMVKGCHGNYALGTDQYPKMLVDAYNVLNTHQCLDRTKIPRDVAVGANLPVHLK